eukprot:GILI01020938.1.p1 GENE.GILI01020938.1~~GILI01020938.1.p1  ORF type:complete len:395 (+),score=16.87 GILI01020938.1:79-1185(+)
MPPYWIISDIQVASAASLSKENVKGFALFWYDNLLLVGDSGDTRVRCLEAFRVKAEAFHVKWKVKNDLGYGNDMDAFDLSVGKCTFLGIDVRYKELKGLEWAHTSKNIARWALLLEIIRAMLLNWSWRDIAALVGIVVWHCNLLGGGRGPLNKFIPILQLIGKSCLVRGDYSRRADRMGPLRDLLLDYLRDEVIAEKWQSHKAADRLRAFDRVHYWASDAMSSKGAWVNLDSEEFLAWDWDTVQAQRHISWKETSAAMTALHAALGEAQKGTLIVIAVDNSSAAASLRKGCVAFDKELDDGLNILAKKYKEKGVQWQVFHIPGPQQPADEPSRGSPPVTDKVLSAKSFLGVLVAGLDMGWSQVLLAGC